MQALAIKLPRTFSWDETAVNIWERMAEHFPLETQRVVLKIQPSVDFPNSRGITAPPTPLPLLHSWIKLCRMRWPAAEVILCWRGSSSIDAYENVGLAVLAEETGTSLVDLSRTEHVLIRQGHGRAVPLPLLWLLPSTFFLFAAPIALPNAGLQGASLAMAECCDLTMSGWPLSAVLPQPTLVVLDMRRVAMVLSAEQVVTARPQALVVAGSAAEADEVGQQVLRSEGLGPEVWQALQPDQIAEHWDAVLTNALRKLERVGAAVVRQPLLTRLPRIIDRLQRGMP